MANYEYEIKDNAFAFPLKKNSSELDTTKPLGKLIKEVKIVGQQINYAKQVYVRIVSISVNNKVSIDSKTKKSIIGGYLLKSYCKLISITVATKSSTSANNATWGSSNASSTFKSQIYVTTNMTSAYLLEKNSALETTLTNTSKISKGSLPIGSTFVGIQRDMQWIQISRIITADGVKNIGDFGNLYVAFKDCKIKTDKDGNKLDATKEKIVDQEGNTVTVNENNEVTIKDKDGEEVYDTPVENIQSDNITSTALDDITVTPDDVYLDDAFTISYNINGDISNTDYQANIEGLTIKSVDAILGIPHQFLPTADARIDTNSGAGNASSIGRLYAEKIIKQIPLLLVTPGVPSFLSSAREDQKKTIIENFLGGGSNEDEITKLINEYNGKYYTLKYAYTSYFEYVNAMLRSAAIFLGIEKEILDGDELATYNWYYKTTGIGGDNTDIYGNEALNSYLGPYAGCIAFYADCGNTVDDSFSNSTTQSQLASSLNSLSDTGRELNFLIGNIGSLTGLELDKLMGSESLLSNTESMTSEVDKLLGNNNIVSNILSKASDILAGGRMEFPEIWSDSTFSRSYSCKMKLISPSGDKLSIFLNILVPIYHLLALTLPRQNDGQSYYSPFLVRAYSKGLFNIDTGIITDLSITKGAEGEWTPSGLPTVADVSFSIKDLYDQLFMSSSTDLGAKSIINNISELDYIANSCGVNINDQEIGRMLKLYKYGIVGALRDTIQLDIFASMGQWINQKLNNVFGVF